MVVGKRTRVDVCNSRGIRLKNEKRLKWDLNLSEGE